MMFNMTGPGQITVNPYPNVNWDLVAQLEEELDNLVIPDDLDLDLDDEPEEMDEGGP